MEIVLTPTLILSTCAGIVTISGATIAIYKLISFLRSPELDQTKRIERLEQRMDEHERRLNRDRDALEEITTSTRMNQKALLALLAHGIDGNEVETMRNAKHEMETYLINRK